MDPVSRKYCVSTFLRDVFVGCDSLPNRPRIRTTTVNLDPERWKFGVTRGESRRVSEEESELTNETILEEWNVGTLLY